MIVVRLAAYVFYKCIAQFLPQPPRLFGLGKWLRGLACRPLLLSCGRNVNIERLADDAFDRVATAFEAGVEVFNDDRGSVGGGHGRAWIATCGSCANGASIHEQRREPGLLEVPVTGQRFVHAMLPHDQERDAVSERPIFVRAAGVELHSSIKE